MFRNDIVYYYSVLVTGEAKCRTGRVFVPGPQVDFVSDFLGGSVSSSDQQEVARLAHPEEKVWVGRADTLDFVVGFAKPQTCVHL